MTMIKEKGESKRIILASSPHLKECKAEKTA